MFSNISMDGKSQCQVSFSFCSLFEKQLTLIGQDDSKWNDVLEDMKSSTFDSGYEKSNSTAPHEDQTDQNDDSDNNTFVNVTFDMGFAKNYEKASNNTSKETDDSTANESENVMICKKDLIIKNELLHP